MRHLWVHRDIAAPADRLWELLANPEHWADWGPSITGVAVDEPLGLGTTGTVTTAVGVRLPFEVTRFTPGRRWAWSVAGIPATDHSVEPLGPDRCRVGFGAPWVAAPYLVVCTAALRRLESIASV